MNATPRRVFFALWPAPEVRRQLAAAAATHAHGGRQVPEEQLHLTLAFAGAVSEARVAALRASAATVAQPAFALRLDRFGAFAAAGVQWLAPGAPPVGLMRLADSLGDLLAAEGIQRRPGAFAPHVTVRRRAPWRAVQSIAPVDWAVRDFVLLESGREGRPGGYRVLERWPLL